MACWLRRPLGPGGDDHLSHSHLVALATGGGHFGAVRSDIAYFGSASGGWSSDSLFPRDMGDVNGDGRADIVGFGSLGVQVSLAGQPFI